MKEVLGLDIRLEQGLSRACSDKIVEQFSKSKNPITCKGSGCYHCCSLDVDCLPEEVQKLAELVIHGEVEINTAALKRRVEGYRDEESKWCPFLIDQKCSVYEDRPIMCSRMLVISDPEHCKEESRENATQIEPKMLDRRWHILAATYGKVRMHVALYNLLKKEGFID